MSTDLEQRFRDALKEGRELGLDRARAPAIRFRDDEIAAVADAIRRKRSVLLVGEEGVGRAAVLEAASRRLRETDGVGVREFSTVQIMAGTLYVGDWQTKLFTILTNAEAQNVALSLSDIANVTSSGTTSKSDQTFLDALEPWVVQGRVRVIGRVSALQLAAIERTPSFAAMFERVAITELAPEHVRTIVVDGAAAGARAATPEACDRLLALCRSFRPAMRGPGPAIELLERAPALLGRKPVADDAPAPAPFGPAEIEAAFSAATGLPGFVISRTETKPQSEIRDWFRARVIGQEQAIDAVVEALTLFKARMHDRARPLGAFLFVGPTGVGKTELARALATFVFGSEKRLLRFDMSEFAEQHSIQQLVGSPFMHDRPARLVDPVRSQPFQVVLFDEIEKAHQSVQDLFLQLLDEGRLSTPTGETVDFRSTFLIATSNAGAQAGAAPAIGFGADTSGYDAERARAEIERSFRPELLNRFQHVVLFHPLNASQATRIAEIEVAAVLKREGVTDRNLVIDVGRDVLERVVAEGFDARFGGRGVKRAIKNRIVLPIATLLMERDLAPGCVVTLTARQGQIRASVIDTEESRAFKAEREPVKVRGEQLTREAIAARVAALAADAAALAERVGEVAMRARVEAVDRARHGHLFWSDAERADRALAAHERDARALERLERLRESAGNLGAAAAAAGARRDRERVAAELVRAEAALAAARREMLSAGPDGWWDALIEIAPMGAAVGAPAKHLREARDQLVRRYIAWAEDRRGAGVTWLREPAADAEPAAFAIRGPYASAYLLGEDGLHRFRKKQGEGAEAPAAVLRVRVAPWRDLEPDSAGDAASAAFEIAEQRALKGAGQLGGKLRSRLTVAGTGLVLQNGETLGENRALARAIGAAWRFADPERPPLVRRYDAQPFRIRDYGLDQEFTRPDTLKPKGLHDLLSARLDRAAAAGLEEAQRKAMP